MRTRIESLAIVAALLFAALVSAPQAARAWNATGHMIVASITYDQLPPEVRAKCVAILEHHPDFAKWQQTEPKDVPGLDYGRYLFMRASTWPDEIRKSGSPYDHPVWHYIDYPLEAPNFPMEPAPANTEDVLLGIAQSEKTLGNAGASAEDRAAALSWLIHLVGDIHQPLHCVTLVNAIYPKPQGDRGGNSFFVSLAGNAVNLHSFWDSLPGTMLDSRDLIDRGDRLQEKFPRSSLPELSQAHDPHAWSLEGRDLAINDVYRHGHLPGGKDMNAVLPPLPVDYTPAARALADRRLTLAGDRLADMLEKLAPEWPAKPGAQ